MSQERDQAVAHDIFQKPEKVYAYTVSSVLGVGQNAIFGNPPCSLPRDW